MFTQYAICVLFTLILARPFAMLFSYILLHLELVWQFVLGKKDALYRIDASQRGVTLSFLAIVIVEPLIFVYGYLFETPEEKGLEGVGGLLFSGLELIIDWGAPPLVLALFCLAFGYRDKIFALIVSYNWLNVIVLLMLLVPNSLVAGHILPMEWGGLLSLCVFCFSLWIEFSLYRFILNCPISVSLGLTSLLFLINIYVLATMRFLSEQLAN